ncbi:hypothetical protein LCL90_02845 [Bacillus infantis]|uniref:hypothetical protein n=1 Tax=Bacillus infantis TaxID=324767 RepID=UPI001CD557F4|nr:hypothetical protein [Bacillus infantis]MCA1033558.1 hypothetical protein [Bacillus infantis]
MIVAAIRNKFNNGEVSVYSSGDVFDFPGKSIVGTKSFSITNEGRVFGHDTGGLFGEEQVKDYSGSIQVTFNLYNVTLSNASSGSLTFTVSLSIKEFIDLYARIPHHKLSFHHEGQIPFIYESEGESFLDKLEVKNNRLSFTKDSLADVRFYRIKSVKEEKNFLELSGSFFVQGKHINSLKLYVFDDSAKREMIAKIRNHPTIFTISGDNSCIFDTALTAVIEGEFYKEKDIIVCFDSDYIYFIDEKENRCLFKLLRSQTNAYYNTIYDKIAFESDNQILQINAYENHLKAYLKKDFISDSRILSCKFGKLNGVFAGETWKQEEIGMVSDGGMLRFFTAGQPRLLDPIRFSEAEVQFDHDRMFIIQNNQIALVKAYSVFDLPADKGNSSRTMIGYTAGDEPFFIHQNEEKIVLSQSPSAILHQFYNEEIVDISVKQYGTNDSVFSEIEISTKGERTTIHIPSVVIKDLIYKAYYYSKNKSLDIVSADQLFLSYSRQVNDYLLYQYFGQIFAMYEEIRRIQREEANGEVKNRNIINTLFYAIQALKKHFDAVSIYYPAALDRELQGITNEPSASNHHASRNLQRSLMGITSQINRSLNEIEGSISAVSFVLINREEYTQLINERTNRDLKFSGGMAVAGIAATAVFAPLAPVLMLGGIMSGINTYFRHEDAVKQEEYKKQNEEYRLDFFVGKALDSLDHLIQTLLPYYISETNNSIYQAFNLLSEEMKGYIDRPEVKGKLFNKIAQYYTFKQLPVDETVVVKKGELIELTHSSVNRSELYIEQFQKEVTGNVPKSLETAAIK